MSLVKTSELSGAALNWVLAEIEGWHKAIGSSNHSDDWVKFYRPKYSTDWAQGGPIIEREKITLINNDEEDLKMWFAQLGGGHELQNCSEIQGEHLSCFCIVGDGEFGETPLEAAMRCYVASKLGDEVEIPEALL